MKPRQANIVAEKDIEPVEHLHLASIVTSRLHSRNFPGRSCDSSGSNGKLLCTLPQILPPITVCESCEGPATTTTTNGEEEIMKVGGRKKGRGGGGMMMREKETPFSMMEEGGGTNGNLQIAPFQRRSHPDSPSRASPIARSIAFMRRAALISVPIRIVAREREGGRGRGRRRH